MTMRGDELYERWFVAKHYNGSKWVYQHWDTLSVEEKARWDQVAREITAYLDLTQLPASTSSDDELVRWVDQQSPLMLMRLYKLLNAQGFRMASIDHRIRVEEAKLRRTTVKP